MRRTAAILILSFSAITSVSQTPHRVVYLHCVTPPPHEPNIPYVDNTFTLDEAKSTVSWYVEAFDKLWAVKGTFTPGFVTWRTTDAETGIVYTATVNRSTLDYTESTTHPDGTDDYKSKARCTVVPAPKQQF